jgi:hypothetical protein
MSNAFQEKKKMLQEKCTKQIQFAGESIELKLYIKLKIFLTHSIQPMGIIELIESSKEDTIHAK